MTVEEVLQRYSTNANTGLVSRQVEEHTAEFGPNTWPKPKRRKKRNPDQEKLSSLIIPRCIVIRNSIKMRIEASQLVPGDIVLLEAGEQVPADLRLIECASFKLDVSCLTGQAELQACQAEASNLPAILSPNLAFGLSLVVEGTAKVIRPHFFRPTHQGDRDTRIHHKFNARVVVVCRAW